MAHKRLGGFERLKALKAKADKQISERKSQISEARKAAPKKESSAADRARRDKKIKALNDKMDLLREDKKRINKRIKSLSVGENFKKGVKSGIKQAVTGIGGGVASKGVKAIKSRVGSKAAKKKIQTKGPEFYRAKKKKK